MGGNKGTVRSRERFVVRVTNDETHHFSFWIGRCFICGYLHNYPEKGKKYVIAKQRAAGFFMGEPRAFFKTEVKARVEGALLVQKLNAFLGSRDSLYRLKRNYRGINTRKATSRKRAERSWMKK